MKIEMPNNNTVVINEGDFILQELPNGYALGYDGRYTPVDLIAGMQDDTSEDSVALDPARYLNGENWFTIEQSANRALWRVYNEIWNYFNSELIGDTNMLRESITHMIREGMGRQAVYALAGAIKRDRKNGLYHGLPLAYVFKGLVDGVVQQEDAASYATNNT